MPRLRAADAKAASLLETGRARSATFRQVADTIERSDLMIYVETGPIASPAQLQFVTAASGWRFLRVGVRVPARDAELVAWLGHELWHAVEIAGAPEVVDQASLMRHYDRIGRVNRKSGSAESAQAQVLWARILREVRYGR